MIPGTTCSWLKSLDGFRSLYIQKDLTYRQRGELLTRRRALKASEGDGEERSELLAAAVGHGAGPGAGWSGPVVVSGISSGCALAGDERGGDGRAGATAVVSRGARGLSLIHI